MAITSGVFDCFDGVSGWFKVDGVLPAMGRVRTVLLGIIQHHLFLFVPFAESRFASTSQELVISPDKWTLEQEQQVTIE